MIKIKVALTALLYIASCIAIVATHEMVSALVVGYTIDYPASFGALVPAFTSLSLSLISKSALICWGTLVASMTLCTFAIWRSNSRDTKLYWVSILSSLNFYVSTFVVSTILIGFFLLPKLANGA